MACQHLQFSAFVAVNRITDTPDGPIKSLAVDLSVHCVDCGKRLQFVGLPAGVNTAGATVSPDGLEARLAAVMQGNAVSAIDAIAAHLAPPKEQMN